MFRRREALEEELLTVGAVVRIAIGKHCGEEGSITRLTDHYLYVRTPKGIRYKKKTSVVILSLPSASLPPTPSRPPSPSSFPSRVNVQSIIAEAKELRSDLARSLQRLDTLEEMLVQLTISCHNHHPVSRSR